MPTFAAIALASINHASCAIDGNEPRNARLRGEIKQRRQSITLRDRKRDGGLRHIARRVFAGDEFDEVFAVTRARLAQSSLRESAATIKQRDHVARMQSARTKRVPRLIASNRNHVALRWNEFDMEPKRGHSSCEFGLAGARCDRVMITTHSLEQS